MCTTACREQGGKRDREKVTKVHFIEFWVAVLQARKKRENVPYKLINSQVSLASNGPPRFTRLLPLSSVVFYPACYKRALQRFDVSAK